MDRCATSVLLEPSVVKDRTTAHHAPLILSPTIDLKPAKTVSGVGLPTHTRTNAWFAQLELLSRLCLPESANRALMARALKKVGLAIARCAQLGATPTPPQILCVRFAPMAQAPLSIAPRALFALLDSIKRATPPTVYANHVPMARYPPLLELPNARRAPTECPPAQAKARLLATIVLRASSPTRRLIICALRAVR
jgi:hypothetical protein